jgi:hypothetical protein
MPIDAELLVRPWTYPLIGQCHTHPEFLPGVRAGGAPGTRDGLVKLGTMRCWPAAKQQIVSL